MNDLKDLNKIDDKKVVKEIFDVAIKNLRERSHAVGIDNPLMKKEINNINKGVLKIDKEINKKEKIKKLRSFLLNNCYTEKRRTVTPLELFSADCAKIFRVNFIDL